MRRKRVRGSLGTVVGRTTGQGIDVVDRSSEGATEHRSEFMGQLLSG